MTIKNIDSIGNYVGITPFKVKFLDSLNCNSLVANIINDNLTDGCVIKYSLYNIEQNEDSSYTTIILYTDTISIIGDDYTSWSGDNEYIYTYIGSHLSITIL